MLVLLFKDFLPPITILVALPLSIGGAVAGLLLYGPALDLPAMIGILMLMGIVTKNSILLVEFANEKRREGGRVGMHFCVRGQRVHARTLGRLTSVTELDRKEGNSLVEGWPNGRLPVALEGAGCRDFE